jgi:hypothetical protein
MSAWNPRPGNDARKSYLCGVCQAGELTEAAASRAQSEPDPLLDPAAQKVRTCILENEGSKEAEVIECLKDVKPRFAVTRAP